jgi:subtilisin family serine protease
MKAFEKCVDSSRKEPDLAHPRVKIAVLDTGLDITHPEISREILEGRIKFHDFVEDSTSIKDLDGHGTHCTSLVAKFAPNSEIYVGRVFKISKAVEDSPVILAKVSLRI